MTASARPWSLWPLTASLALLATGALCGGVALVAAPDGHLLQFPPGTLAGSPFRTFLIPGLLLLGVFGLGSLAALLGLWRRPGPQRGLPVPGLQHHHWAWSLALGIGVGQLIWIGTQLLLLPTRFPALQAGCAALGLIIAALTLTPGMRAAFQLERPAAAARPRRA